MKKTLLLAALCGTLATFTSCNKQKDASINFIPSEVSSVTQINIKQIKEKNTNLSGVIDYIAGETDEVITKIYNSGVDLDKSIFAYSGKIDEETPYYGALFSVNDLDKFKSTLTTEINCTFSEKDGVTTGVLPNKKGLITLKENTGLWINILDENLSLGILNETDETKKLINSNENFKKSLSDDDDVSIWVNLEETKSIAHHLDPKVAVVQDEIDLSDSYLTSGINFNNGEITIDNNILGNKENFASYQNLYNDEVSNTVLSIASGENLILAYLMSINLEELLTIAKNDPASYDGVKEFLSRFNVTPEALADALTGEIILTVNGLDGLLPFSYKGSIALGVKDGQKTKEILDNLSSYGLNYNEKEDLYKSAFLLAKVNNNSLLLAGPNLDFAKDLIQGKGEKLSDTKINNSNGELLINLDAIPSNLMGNINRLFPVIKEFKSISSSSEFGEQNIMNHIIIKLVKDDINSLSVLSQHSKELM